MRRGIKRFLVDNPRLKNRVFASFGDGNTKTRTPMLDLAKREGETRSKDRSLPWRLLPTQGQRGVRHTMFDANAAKLFLHRRMLTARGSPGAIDYFGSQPHDMIGDHYDAETRIVDEVNGRKVITFHLLPSKPDNHFFDTAVGSVVAMSMLGVSLDGHTKPKKPRRPREARKVNTI